MVSNRKVLTLFDRSINNRNVAHPIYVLDDWSPLGKEIWCPSKLQVHSSAKKAVKFNGKRRNCRPLSVALSYGGFLLSLK